MNKQERSFRVYKKEIEKLHMLAEEILEMAEIYRRPISELANLHDIIRKIIHVQD